jgi:hypothetical protein
MAIEAPNPDAVRADMPDPMPDPEPDPEPGGPLPQDPPPLDSPEPMETPLKAPGVEGPAFRMPRDNPDVETEL